MLSALILALAYLPTGRAIWPEPKSSELGERFLRFDDSVKFLYEIRESISDGESDVEPVPVPTIAPIPQPTGGIVDSDSDEDGDENEEDDDNPDEASGQDVGFSAIPLPVNPESTGARRTEAVNVTEFENESLTEAVERIKDIILNKSFVPWKLHARGSTFEPPSLSDANPITSVRLIMPQVDDNPMGAEKLEDIDESYRLEMDDDGDVRIFANRTVGLFHGLTTFAQLFYKHSQGGAYTPFSPAVICDAPVYSHRGVSLDVARSYIPIDSIKRLIEAMSFNKFNRLHIHAVDSQSWPLVISSVPEISEKGAYQPDMVYSPDDVDDLQEYAKQRGIQLIFEINFPAHTASLQYSHPELVIGWKQDWLKMALEPPAGALKLNSPEVYDIIGRILDDFLPRAANEGAYFHTGGDEVVREVYTLDDTLEDTERETMKKHLQKMLNTIHDKVRSNNLSPIVWEELLIEWDLEMGDDVLIQAWKGVPSVQKVVEKGHRVIVGDYFNYYLDCGMGQWYNSDGQYRETRFPYLDYCSPGSSWRKMRAYNLVDSIPENKRHLVVGGEVLLWTEQTDEYNMENRMWPRSSAAAEVFWSGPENSTQAITAYRLAEMRERIIALGVSSGPVYMPWCSMEGLDSCTMSN